MTRNGTWFGKNRLSAAVPILAAVTLLCLAAFIASPTIVADSTPSYVTFTFLDVGQGDSILVRASDGSSMLVDGGPRSAGPTLVERLRQLGVERIDTLVSTHPHEDHIGGLIAVVNAIPIGRVIDSGKVHTSATYEQYLLAIEAKRVPFMLGRQGTNFALGPATVSILWPGSRLPDDLNDCSVVLRVQIGRSSALLPGDAGSEVENALLEAGALSRTTLLKVSHHGSRTSNTTRMLRAAAPRVAVIQCAKDNPYNHPHRETLARLILGQALIYRTDSEGEISVTLRPSERSFSTQLARLGAGYLGSSASSVFHLPECAWASRIREDQLVMFSSRAQAVDAGYSPCRHCNP